MAADTASDPRSERKPKLSERIISGLRQQILNGEIAPGQKLPSEGQLTETYGVSRTVIREAITSLAADGLVESRQGAGVFVLDHPSHAFGALKRENKKVSQAINVLEVRMGIEIESAGLAALRRNAGQEARIQEAFFEFERMLNLGQPTGKADFAFHLEIASATNNPFYVEILQALGDRTIPCDVTSPWYSPEVLTFDYLTGLQREHLLILKAISAGDAEAAREAMRAHLSAARDRYRKRMISQQMHYLAARRQAKTPKT
jgi:GntR family transcriptional regulator, transcriptional repressor for pyruvate dehydrogenase complex